MFVACVALLPGADAARRAEARWAEAQRIESVLRATDWRGSDDDYSALIADAAAAHALQPANVEYAFGLSLYRWQSIAREVDPPLPKTDLLAYAGRIVEGLHATRPLCPTFGPPLTLAGQIELFVLGRKEPGAVHVRNGYRLTPQDPTAAFVVGRLEATAGNAKASLEAFRHAVRLDPSLARDATQVLLNANRPEWAIELAGDDADRLLQLADELERRQADPGVLAAARARSRQALKLQAGRPDASVHQLTRMAAIAEDSQDYPAAAGYWRRALAMQLTNAEWRVRLARCLVAAGDMAGAKREVDTVLRAQPRNAEAARLNDELDGGLQP
jgi:tetratricopeptide (TPR) repeat protein